MADDTRGWDDYRLFVVKSLDDIQKDHREFRTEVSGWISKLRNDMSAQSATQRAETSSAVATARSETMAAMNPVLTQVPKMQVEIAILQVKAGVWGLLGGCIPVLFALFVAWATGKL